MKYFKNIALGILLLAMTTGCATQKAWVYKPSKYEPPQSAPSKTVAVLPFEDQRDDVNSNKLMLYMIPFFPCGWADMNAPEGSQMHLSTGMWMNYKPTDDYAKALVSELNSAGFLKEVYFANRKSNENYYIKGTILDTKYKAQMFSYGLSVYGPLLWFFGLPAGHYSNDLAVELSCIEIPSGKIILSKIYSADQRSKVVWIYALGNDFNYSEMLREAYRQFAIELSDKID